MKADLGEGLRYVLGHRYLRWIAASTATFNFWGNLMFAVYVVYMVRELELGPTVIGLIFAVGSVGYLVGAVVTHRLSSRLGVGPTIVLGAALGIANLLVPLAPKSYPEPFLIASQALVSLGLPIYNVTQVSLRQAITPERLQGRMNSVMRFIVWGVIPLGTLLGGVLASAVSLRFAIWVGAIGSCTAFLPVLLSSVRSLKTVPEAPESPPEEEVLAGPGFGPPAVDDRV
jgi:MFS family permease